MIINFYQYKNDTIQQPKCTAVKFTANKLKSAIRNETEVVLRLSSVVTGDNESTFPHKLLLTNTQIPNLCKAFANYLSTYIKLSKTQLATVIQSVTFLARLLGSLLKTGLPLIKNIIKLLALGLTAAASAADAGIHKKVLGSGHNRPSSSASHNTTLIISNDEMEDIIKIVKSLEDYGLLLKGVSKTVQNEAKEQNGWFLVYY